MDLVRVDWTVLLAEGDLLIFVKISCIHVDIGIECEETVEADLNGASKRD